MTQITTDMIEDDYKNLKGYAEPFIKRCLKAYEAEHNKIGPGDWFTVKDKWSLIAIKACAIRGDKVDGSNNATYILEDYKKVSPELQKRLDKETEQS